MPDTINFTVNETVDNVEITVINEVVEVNVIRQSGGGGGTSDLSLTASPTNNVISNTDGTGFTIPLADATNAGLLKPAKFSLLELTTEAFTTALKTAYDATISFISAISTATVPDSTNKRYVTDTNLTKINAIDQAISTAEKATWNGKQDALVSSTNIKTINGNSVLGAGNLVVANTAFRHIFAFDASFAASTTWYAPNRESGTLYSVSFIAGSTYNGTTILEPRCIKLQIPANCKLKNAQVVYSTLATPLDIRIIYFEYVSTVVNQLTIASTTLAANTANSRVTFSTIDLTSTLNANGYVTFALFNNNIATGIIKNVQIILDFE